MELCAGTSGQFAGARAKLPGAAAERDWFTSHRLRNGTRYVAWNGLFEFLVSADGRRILYLRHEQASLESFNVYLLGQVLSFSLISFGAEPLHGTAVAVNGEAVAFLGDCGYGKSTLGAAFLARGFPIITDDLVALDREKNGWTVNPGIPRLKLFPSVARRLLGVKAGGTALNAGTSKLVLPLDTTQSVAGSLPLRAIYVLSHPREQKSRRLGGVEIGRLSGREAFLEVVRAAFNLIVLEKARLANQFEFAARLSVGVPLRRLAYPRRLAALPMVCDAVLADLARAVRSDSTCDPISTRR